MFFHFALLLVVGLGGANQSSRISDTNWQLALEPFALARSPSFTVTAQQALRLSTDARSDLSLDAFVYDADTKELEGRSDDDVIEPNFEWSATKAGRYYVVVHNVSSETGIVTISVGPRNAPKTQASSQTPNCAVMNVYYATDREKVAQDSKGTTYGTEIASSDLLNFGIAKVSIPRSHLMGELEGPSILKLEFRENSERHIVLLSATPEESQPFFSRLANRVSQSANHEALVFVPGFNVSFEDATRRTAQIAYDLGFDGPTILYSWPSQGKLGLLDYEKDLRNANLSVPHLRSFLTQLSERTAPPLR